MTRINTNISSLVAQNALRQSNLKYDTALLRLSTGLKINSGADDPAGLIASELLKSEIASVEQSITNSQRAVTMINTADSGLSQVNSLLDSIRALVQEAANTGAMSDEQIAANQLQVDASLQAIDRIASTTEFQNSSLLDGSLDFITANINTNAVNTVKIQQATFGSNEEINVNVKLKTQAVRAQLTYTSNTIGGNSSVELQVGGLEGFQAFNFANGTSVQDMANAVNLLSDSTGVLAEISQVTATAAQKGTTGMTGTAANSSVTITAVNAGNGNGNVSIQYVLNNNNGATTASYNNTNHVLTVSLGTQVWVASTGAISNADANVTGTFNLNARLAGAQYNGVTVVLDATNAAANTAYFDFGTKTIHVSARNNTVGATNDAINACLGQLFSSTSFDDTQFLTEFDNASVTLVGNTAAGVTGGAVLANAWDVANAINTTASCNVVVSGANAGDGTGVVTLANEAAYFGSANLGQSTDTNNYLEFLSNSILETLPIVFVTDGASSSFSAELMYDASGVQYSSATLQGTEANATIKVTANTLGTSWDNVKVQIVTDGANGAGNVAYDTQNNVLTVHAGTGDSAANVVNYINTDSISRTYFTASNLGNSDGTGNVGDTGAIKMSGYVDSFKQITVHLATDANGTVTTTANDLIAYSLTSSSVFSQLGIQINNAGILDGYTSNGAGTLTTGTTSFLPAYVNMQGHYASGDTYTSGGNDASSARFHVEYLTAGSSGDGIKVLFAANASANAAGNESFSWDADTDTLTVNVAVDGGSNVAQVLTAFQNLATSSNSADRQIATMFAITAVTANNTTANVWAGDFAVLNGGYTNDSAASNMSAGVKLTGNYDVNDSIGVDGLKFKSTACGSDAFVSVIALSGTFSVVDNTGNTATRATGNNADVVINGIQAVSSGTSVTLSTSTLALTLEISANMAANTSTDFQITGGGALFQLGASITAAQQASIGISSVSTATLGGKDGRLYELATGGDASLTGDVAKASRIVDEAITQISDLRGRLGAFVSTTLETNIDTLSDANINLADAQSQIADADFAAESANLTQAQILVQSGTAVLSIANSRPQQILSLLPKS